MNVQNEMSNNHPNLHLGNHNRRWMLKNTAAGFGYLAFQSLLDQVMGDESTEIRGAESGPLAARKPHFEAKAKRIVFLFMKGGPSHVDTFDPKPLLDRD
ncbi:MAG: DUF1501 domain-containing protein, partial [Pirellula staleyi]